MKKIILLIAFIVLSFGVEYNGKIIGKVKINGGFFDGGTLNVYCINGIQYMGDLSSAYQSSLTPIFNPNGTLKKCN